MKRLLLFLVALSGCAEPSPLSLAVEGAVDGAVVPSIEAFETEAVAFEAATETFCADPSEAALSDAQDRWLALMATWNRAGVYRMGPLDDDPIVPTIDLIESKRPRGTDYTQTVRETIAADVSGDAALDAAYFSGLNFNRGGLLALEVLLFEDGSDPASNLPADVLASFAGNARRCTYLRGTAALLTERAEGAAAGWTESFGEAGTPFRDQVVSGVLPNGSEAAVALVVVAVEHARYLSRRKLEGVPDVQLAEAARPEERPFFGNLEIAVTEIDTLFSSSTTGPSLYGVMEERGFQDVADSLRAAVAEALMWIRAGNEEGVIRALQDVDTVLVLFVPDALDIMLPLNFNDGD